MTEKGGEGGRGLKVKLYHCFVGIPRFPNLRCRFLAQAPFQKQDAKYVCPLTLGQEIVNKQKLSLLLSTIFYCIMSMVKNFSWDSGRRVG